MAQLCSLAYVCGRICVKLGLVDLKCNSISGHRYANALFPPAYLRQLETWAQVGCGSFLRRGLTQRYSLSVKTPAGRKPCIRNRTGILPLIKIV
jgi:hypothetical protein